MKASLLLLAGILAVSSAFAQTQKGNGILSASFSVTYNRQHSTNSASSGSDYTTTWSPAVALTAGRFWADNWLAGLTVSESSTFIRQQYARSASQQLPFSQVNGTLTPFFRRYWPVGPVYVFAGAGVSVTAGLTKQTVFDTNGDPVVGGAKTSSWGINPQAEVGGNYFLSNRLSLEVVARTSSFPLSTASVSAGLVYWTGVNRKAGPQTVSQPNPQTDKGKWVLEGTFSVANQEAKQIDQLSTIGNTNTVSSYIFSPSIGFFVKKNTLLGVSIPLSYSRSTSALTDANLGSYTSNLWQVGISPYVQHYWLTSKLTPYTRATISYLHANAGSYSGGTVVGGASIGLAYMAGQRFIIETSLLRGSMLFARNTDTNDTYTYQSGGATLSAGLSGGFALRYVLSGK